MTHCKQKKKNRVLFTVYIVPNKQIFSTGNISIIKDIMLYYTVSIGTLNKQIIKPTG